MKAMTSEMAEFLMNMMIDYGTEMIVEDEDEYRTAILIRELDSESFWCDCFDEMWDEFVSETYHDIRNQAIVLAKKNMNIWNFAQHVAKHKEDK